MTTTQTPVDAHLSSVENFRRSPSRSNWDAIEASARALAAIPEGFALVPVEIVDRFPEINPSNYDRMTHEYRKGFIDGQIDMRDRPEEQGEPWLSIDCAPKNGSPIILGRAPDEYDKDGFAGQGRWYEAEEDCPDQMGHDAGFMDDCFAYFRFSRHFGKPSSLTQGLQPTHWMHLPPPPEQGSKG